MTGAFRELKPGSFIYCLPDALDSDCCADIVNRFESSPHHQRGLIGPDAALDLSIKQSTDLRISGRAEWQDIDGALFESLKLGLSLLSGLHPFFASNKFKDMGYQLQRTAKGEFYQWHVDAGPGPLSQRQLVAIWYLNSLPDREGQTEFFHQDVNVRPETGALLLFPPFWTHLHQGQKV
ncbi:MAG: 2OG-Fe(II) oxygenase, partial [Arenicellales bacterium]|nr:2OG-Fe(II) oxygenase [Arenicellales bacterium]